MIALVDGPAKADRMLTTLGWRRRATTVSHSVPSHCRLISSGKGRRTSIAAVHYHGQEPRKTVQDQAPSRHRHACSCAGGSRFDLSNQCIEAVRETIERTIEDLRRTGATTFEELFAAVVKVIENLKRKTLPRDDAKVRRRPRTKQLTPGLATPNGPILSD